MVANGLRDGNEWNDEVNVGFSYKPYCTLTPKKQKSTHTALKKIR